MQTAPAYWNDILSGEHDKEIKVVINNVEYGMDKITTCHITKNTFDQLSIGHAPSAVLDLGLFIGSATIPRAAGIQVYIRLRNDEHTTAWVTKGTFYIDQRAQDGEYIEITAYDRMLMAEENYFSDGIITGTWPRAATTVVSEIATRMGLAVDSRSTINASISVPSPVGMTMREVLCSIAAAHGGNFVISDDNKLYLMQLEDLPSFVYLGDEQRNYVGDEQSNKVVIFDSPTHSSVCASFEQTADQVTISKVILDVDDDRWFEAGDDTGYSIEATCTFATQAVCNSVLAALSGVRYNSVSLESAFCDPLLELGDGMLCNGLLFRIMGYDVDVADYCLNVTAPIDGEVDHEYPYQDKTQNAIKRDLNKARAEIKMTTDAITAEVADVAGNVSTLSQTVDGVSTEVSNVDGRVTTLSQTVDGVSTQVSNVQGSVAELSLSVDSISLGVSNNTDYSTIRLYKDEIQVASAKVQFTGNIVFESDLSGGYTSINGACIDTGTISADFIKLGGQMDVYQSLSGTARGGYMGYMYGESADGNITTGIGMMNSDTTGQMLCSNAGARIGYADTSSVTCTNNRITLTAEDYVYVNCYYLIPNNDGSFIGSYSHHWTTGYIDTLYTSAGTVSKSDRRAKKNISYKNISKYLKLFNLLKPCIYKYKGRKRRHMGMVAQEVEEAMHAVGIPNEDFAGLIIDEQGEYGLRYEEFIPMLIAKVQEQDKTISNFAKRIKELEGKNG